jgi:hypothetical protein
VLPILGKCKRKEQKAAASSQVLMTDFFKGNNHLPHSDIPDCHTRQSAMSENLNDKSAVSES